MEVAEELEVVVRVSWLRWLVAVVWMCCFSGRVGIGKSGWEWLLESGRFEKEMLTVLRVRQDTVLASPKFWRRFFCMKERGTVYT